MMHKLMLGVALSALMAGGAFAQSSPTPNSNTQTKPPAAAPAKPDTSMPAAKSEKQPAAKPESSAANKSDKAKPESSAANTSDKAKTGDQTAATAATDTASKPKVIASQSPDEFLASNFDGMDVIGENGKKIGDVADILFTKNATIKAYVVSFGGFLGMGAKEVAIAPTAFQVVPAKKGNGKQLKLSMTQKDLKSAQKFAAYKPPKSTATTTGAGGMGGGMGGGAHPAGGMPATSH